MPQASSELQKWAQDKFGTLDDTPVCRFLESEGFTETRGFEWEKEGVTSWDQLTDDQKYAINFLIDEWDYGGLITTEVKP
ncbi:hypothetical protein EVB87_071 [Rhizobium phage RHph_N28_1]|nr:hypothetical protein EVB87_071 [Rhizobium phage RHph_N28_1]QIG74099.1 hypothetical protein EVC07_071 [Rhizobium phage RHph_N42]QIG74705.1 hypothetical protein EVC12_070 [Rhizobium phage RHph_I42]